MSSLRRSVIHPDLSIRVSSNNPLILDSDCVFLIEVFILYFYVALVMSSTGLSRLAAKYEAFCVLFGWMWDPVVDGGVTEWLHT